jgi:hypothetical protein
VVVVIESGALIALLLGIKQDLFDPLDLGQVKLLEECIECGTTLPPILSLSRCRCSIWLSFSFSLNSLLDGDSPLFHYRNELIDESWVLLDLLVRLVWEVRYLDGDVAVCLLH